LAVESSGPYIGISQEVRYYSTISVDGFDMAISGQPDWYDQEQKILDDYKYTSYPPNSPREEHEAQLNVYAWLLENNNLDVEKARVIYLHPKSRQTGKRQTTYHVPLWSTEAVERYIVTRLRPHAQYLKDNNMAKLKLDPGDAWKAQFCPFRHGCNPGRCCST
jgi:CRISPR/Cas system-associated exonuclease Cas4 (RecB family)